MIEMSLCWYLYQTCSFNQLYQLNFIAVRTGV